VTREEIKAAVGKAALQERKARQDEIANCAYCQANKGQMAPRHFASPRCESGRHNHCSCEICF
jgi:hypothetical protein